MHSLLVRSVAIDPDLTGLGVFLPGLPSALGGNGVSSGPPRVVGGLLGLSFLVWWSIGSWLERVPAVALAACLARSTLMSMLLLLPLDPVLALRGVSPMLGW